MHGVAYLQHTTNKYYINPYVVLVQTVVQNTLAQNDSPVSREELTRRV